MNNDCVVLITGTSSGFGRLTAELLAKNGCTVYASMRSTAGHNGLAARELEELSSSNCWELKTLNLDVTDSASVETGVEQVLSETGKIDVLINNAGSVYAGVTEAFTEEQALSQFDVNFMSTVRLHRAILPSMRERGSGLVINVSSVIGRVVLPYYGLYCASKFAVEALAESLRYELVSHGVDMVILEPSLFPTPIFQKVVEPADSMTVDRYDRAAQYQRAISDQVLSIFGADAPPNPQEVADAVLCLIELPFGARPLRTIVGKDLGVADINAAAQEKQNQLLQFFGLEGPVSRSGAAL